MATMEQLFEALRNADAAGDADAAQRIAQIIQREQQNAASSQPLRYEDQNPEESVDSDYFRSDRGWIEASKIIYRKNEGQDFEGTDEEASDYGLDQMGWFNYNIPAMALDANSLRNASQEEKDAFLYLMDGYDDLGMSWDGTWRFLKGVATDPTTYVGLSSFGIGTVGAQGGKIATKEGLRQLLKAGARAGVVAGAEGAIFGATDETIRQSVEIEAGRREGYSVSEIGTSAALGAAAGAVLGGTVGAGASALKGRKASKSLVDETEELLGGAQKAIEATPEASARVTPDAPEKPLTEAPELPKAANDNGPAPRITPEPVVTPAKQVEANLTNIVDTVRSFSKTIPDTVTDGTQSMKALRESTQGLADLMETASKQGDDLSSFLTKMEITASQMQGLKNASQQATDSLKRELASVIKQKHAASDPKQVKSLQTQADELEKALGTTERVDLELSTQSGRDLRMRKEGLNVDELRDVTPEKLMDQKGYSRGDAEREYLRLMGEREDYLKSTGELREVEQKISEAIRQGDFAEALKLKKQKKSLITRTDTQQSQQRGIVGKVARVFNRAMDLTAEIMISMVFSPSTLIVNVVPSFAKLLYRPALDVIAKDAFSKAAYKEAVASYSMMASMVPSAFKAAKAAYKFERSFLLDDASRLLEGGGPIIPKKYGGGILRFFPRMLQATDEFFSQIAYRGYVIGHATSQAYEEGLAKGLSGKRLDAFVRKQTKTQADKIYSKNPEKDERVVDILLDQAQDRGLHGPKADAWVKKQLAKNPDLYARAENEAGKDYVKDLLFKREFSGTHFLSKAARSYEKLVKDHPLIRVAGQLFFRTPVRVFEEGIRLTPGLNLISPNFMADLAGKNGTLRQVRAQGEAMMSYGFAGAIMTLYGQGAITGAGPTDYKQRRQGENTDEFEPYTITLPNGDKWSYRNVDPLSTPLKIIVNALERYETLQYRVSQGEHVDDNAWQMAYAYLKVGTGAIAQAIRDASLTQGVDQIMDLVDMFGDEKDNSGLLLKAMGQKLNTLIPNTWYKTQLLEDPVLNDPATLEQFLRTRINPQDEKVPRMFTALGRERRLSNPEAGLMVFSPSTEEERDRGIPEKEMEVERELWTMAQVGDTNFQAPYKHPFLGTTDLRTRMTKDGKEPLYNRWMRYTHEGGLVDDLHNALVNTELPYGTPGSQGPRFDIARQILNAHRNAAFVRLMAEEIGLEEEFIEYKMRSERLRLGERDNLNVPFR